MAENGSVPFWWIVLFVLLALGAGIGSVFLVGGSIFTALPGLLL
jgi:ABC-type multidrug transport system permease subunit